MRIWSLQVLRFWAALGVCVFHALALGIALTGKDLHLSPAMTSVGQAGVDVFFVLSGVIITVTSRGLTVSQFAAKRANRILPLWLATAVPALVLLQATGRADWRTWLATLTFWPATDRMTAPIDPGWTLSFEALFYTCAALVIWRPRLAWVLLAGYALAATLHGDLPVLQFVGNPLIVEFLLGVAITRLPSWKPGKWLVPAGVAAMLLGAPMVDLGETGAQLLAGSQGWGRTLFFGVPAAVIVYGSMQMEARPGILSKLGDASYAIYLLHPVLLVGTFAALRMGAPSLPALPGFAIATAVVVLVSWRAHEIIEKPLMKWFARGGPLPWLAPRASGVRDPRHGDA